MRVLTIKLKFTQNLLRRLGNVICRINLNKRLFLLNKFLFHFSGDFWCNTVLFLIDHVQLGLLFTGFIASKSLLSDSFYCKNFIFFTIYRLSFPFLSIKQLDRFRMQIWSFLITNIINKRFGDFVDVLDIKFKTIPLLIKESGRPFEITFWRRTYRGGKGFASLNLHISG